MAVTEQTPINTATANGVTTTFPYSFTLLSDGDLVVQTVDATGVVVTKTLGADYTVTGVGSETGGSVIFTTAPANGYKVVMFRDSAVERRTDYQDNGDLPASTLNGDFDRLWLVLQEVFTGGKGVPTALRVPNGETVSALPDAASRALRILAFDASGNVSMLAGVDTSSAAALGLDLLSGSSTKGTKLVTFLQTGTGAVARLLQSKLSDVLSVRDFGATGDGVTDDTAAIQAAITAAQARAGAEVYFPPREPGQYYKITAPLKITAPVKLRGAGASAVQLIAPAGAIASGSYMLDIDCLAGDNVEHITVEGMTIRSLDAVPNGIRLKNAGECDFSDVRVYNVANGLSIDGTRCFSNTFTRFVCYSITNAGLRFLSTFAGGGQFTFKGCTFLGAYGVQIPAGALTDTLVFEGCNFEQCTTRAMQINGTAQGVTLLGGRGEAGSGSGFEFAPTSSHEVVGLTITGMSYYNGTVAAVPIILGTSAGTGGRVRGFSITGNRVGYAGLTYFVQMYAEAQSGFIGGNHFSEVTTAVVSANRAGVLVVGNENGAGRLPEYWGANLVEQGTFTATATGMTTSPTGTCKYSVNDGAVTLDLPNITGTSNATTFTLTGAPASIRPAADKDVLCRVQDNSGAVGLGLMRMKTTGVIELYVSAAGSAFTAAGTKSVNPMSVTYML